ncbi:hypothetical protein SLA2020_004410 [Shorea laevis]
MLTRGTQSWTRYWIRLRLWYGQNGVAGVRLHQTVFLNGSPAERASGVRVEPHVYTLYVETVITLGQNPTRFVFFELRQANGAVRGGIRMGFGGVGKNREGLQDTSIEASHGSGGEVVTRVYNDDGLPMGGCAATAGAGLTAASTEEEPAGVEVERKHENHNKKQNHHHGKN